MNGVAETIWLMDLYEIAAPFSVNTIKTTILIISSCSYLIYFTAIIKIPVIKVNTPGNSSRFFFSVFIITLPFYIFKNVSYLHYVFTHGGYIAIYANSGEHLQSVGLFIRLLSNICFSAYLLYITEENNMKWLKYVMIFFVSLSCLELILGLRGKYFVFLLLNVLLYKQKTRRGFKISYLIFISLVVVFTSIFIAFFRENREVESGSLLSKFFYTQGNSSVVSAMAVEKYNVFHPYSLQYLGNSVLLAFKHENELGKGAILATDFTNYLSPQAFDLGFGTGTSFIAELYLLYGIPTVIIGTLFLGLFMSFLKNYTSGITGTLSFILLIGCVYLPRTSYLDPISQLLKYGIPCLFVYSISVFYTLLFKSKIIFSN